MPKIFTKDCKVNVIEYGSTAPGKSWSALRQDFWSHIQKLFNL